MPNENQTAFEYTVLGGGFLMLWFLKNLYFWSDYEDANWIKEEKKC